MKTRLVSSVKSIIATFFSTVIFALLGMLVLYTYFRDNALPADFDLLPDDWAWIFLVLSLISVAAAFLYNLVATLINVIRSQNPSRLRWWLRLMECVLLGAAFAVYILLRYPEEMGYDVWAAGFFVAEHILIFFSSSFFASSIWRNGYFPFSR
ncbi:MAG: hypothetical protein LBT26_03795 [Clostridiales Family XIII bacterium]|jgi:hypothetical protein|nr:hypothetical protein [Clostridiales Family XIII bacterium]